MPKEGKLIYRGINMTDIVRNCQKENRFGYEEVVWLLLLGDLPTQDQLDKFRAVLAEGKRAPRRIHRGYDNEGSVAEYYE